VKKAQPVSELTVNVDYKLEIKTDNNGNQTFELEFLHEIKTAYILEYQSLIVAANNDKVTNKVEFSGNNVQTTITPSTKEIIVKFSSGSGTGSGIRGALTVEKKDELDGTKLLSGATFSLFRVSGSDRILVNTLTTVSDGKIEFKKLLAGEYILKEVAAPAGYDLDSKDHQVTINSATPIKKIITNKKSVTPTPTPTVTPTSTPTSTPTPTPTPTPTVTPTPTPTSTPATPSPTPATPTPTTSVETPSPTPATPSPTSTPSATPATPTPTTSVAPTPTPTATTPLETASPSPTPVPTKEPVTEQKKTDKDTLLEGEVEVPLGGKPSVGQKPKNGTVDVDPDGRWVYKPDSGYIGKDHFTIVVKDKDGAEEEYFIDIDVEDVPLGVTPPVKELPKTGEERHYYFEMAGLVMLLLGAVLLRSRFSRNK
jgi:LPXTG-motif cell wall-anchored protein